MPEIDTIDMVGRILLAVALGAAIGIERELDAQPAGFRTHILIALGAALFGLVSIQGFVEFAAARGDTNVQIDVTRVASQVVVGVGFLGGGAILKWGPSIHGLTTAASVWVMAAIGLAVGLGYESAAIAVTVAVLISLVVLRWTRPLLRRFARRTEMVVIRLREGAEATSTIALLDEMSAVSVTSVRLAGHDRQVTEIAARFKTAVGQDLSQVLAPLLAEPAVDEVDMEDI